MAPDKMRICISIMPISSPNPMFDHLLESSDRDNSNKWSRIGFGEEIGVIEIKVCSRDDSNKWSNIRFGEEIMEIVLIEVNLILNKLSRALQFCSLHRYTAFSKVGFAYQGIDQNAMSIPAQLDSLFKDFFDLLVMATIQS